MMPCLKGSGGEGGEVMKGGLDGLSFTLTRLWLLYTLSLRLIEMWMLSQQFELEPQL